MKLISLGVIASLTLVSPTGGTGSARRDESVEPVAMERERVADDSLPEVDAASHRAMQSSHAADRLDGSAGSDFVPTFCDHQESLHLDASPGTVFPFFEPKWRRLWRPTWIQEPIFRRAPEELDWGIDRVASDHHATGPEVLVVVTSLDQVAREIQYTIVWGGWEIQKFWITCAPSPGGGTDATIRTMTYGLNDFGNREVSRYCAGGHVPHQNRAYVDAIERHLAKGVEP